MAYRRSAFPFFPRYRPFRRQTTSDAENAEDEIVGIIGGNGPFQRGLFRFGILVSVALAFHNLLGVIIAPEIAHWCARPDFLGDMPLDKYLQGYVPADTDGTPSGCYIYNDTAINSTHRTAVRCNRWDYEGPNTSRTIVIEWDLVCERSWMVSLSTSAYMLGSLLGLLCFGHIGDRFGRRPAIIAAIAVILSGDIGVLTSTTYRSFLIYRSLVGAGTAILYETMLVLAVEMLGCDYRCYFHMVCHFGWGCGCVALGLLGWVLKDWIFIQGFVMLPGVALLRGLQSVTESPTWLVATGRFDRANAVMLRAIKQNRSNDLGARKTWMKLRAELEMSYERRSTLPLISTRDLFSTSKLKLRVVILMYTWFAISFTYYAMTLNMGRLVISVYVSFVLCAFTELLAYGSSMFLLSRYGRKTIESATLFLSAFACAVVACLDEDYAWLGAMFTLLGRFTVASAYGVLCVYSSEVFPPLVRNIGISYSCIFARGAAAIAPFVRELGEATHKRLPFVLYVMLCGLSMVLVLLLPETKLTLSQAPSKQADTTDESQVKHFLGPPRPIEDTHETSAADSSLPKVK